MEQNEEPRNKLIPQLMSPNIWQGSQNNGEKVVSLKNVLGKLDFHMQKNEIGPVSYTTHKKLTQNRLKT